MRFPLQAWEPAECRTLAAMVLSLQTVQTGRTDAIDHRQTQTAPALCKIQENTKTPTGDSIKTYNEPFREQQDHQATGVPLVRGCSRLPTAVGALPVAAMPQDVPAAHCHGPSPRRLPQRRVEKQRACVLGSSSWRSGALAPYGTVHNTANPQTALTGERKVLAAASSHCQYSLFLISGRLVYFLFTYYYSG